MANAFLKPITDKMETILEATLNTRKDAIDSTVVDVPASSVVTSRQASMPESFPWVEIFSFGSSPIDVPENVNVTADFVIATRVTVQGDTEKEATEFLDVYLTSIARSLATGTNGDFWSLDGTVDFLRLRDFEMPSEGELDGTIIKQGALLWGAEKIYDLTA